MMNEQTASSNTTCSQCGEAFHCGYQAGEKTCWCFQLPHIPFDENADDCLCVKCLRERIQQQNESASETAQD